MRRCWSPLLVTAILAASLPVSSQDLVSPKLLPPAAGLRLRAVPNFNLTQDTSSATSAQPAAKHRRWTKGGKIMTFVGLGLMGGGASALGYGLSHKNTPDCSAGNTCVAVDWQWTGVGWLAAGSALTILGLTRHTSN
jgi:hypothetical protein